MGDRSLESTPRGKCHRVRGKGSILWNTFNDGGGEVRPITCNLQRKTTRSFAQATNAAGGLPGGWFFFCVLSSEKFRAFKGAQLGLKTWGVAWSPKKAVRQISGPIWLRKGQIVEVSSLGVTRVISKNQWDGTRGGQGGRRGKTKITARSLLCRWRCPATQP